MKKTNENIEHRIQLKLDEIARYKFASRNYPIDRQGLRDRYLRKLNKELDELKLQLTDLL